MPKPAITTFSSVKVSPTPTNHNNGLYAPKLTTAEIVAIPPSTFQNGFIAYDTTDNRLKTCINGLVEQINTGVGVGDVVGPGAAAQDNIVTFDGPTGKLIKDSGVFIGRVPPLVLLENDFNLLEAPSLLVNEIGNLGHIRFINGVGTIYVDALSPVGFYLNNFGFDSQVCSVFTGGISGIGTTTPSCLVELNSKTGALVLSRLITEEIEELFATPGMILFNLDTNRINYHNGSDWIDFASIELAGAVNGVADENVLNIAVQCQDREQVFLSPLTDDYFAVRIQNQAPLTTILQIGAADAPQIWLVNNPDQNLAYIECHGVPFALIQGGVQKLSMDNIGNIGIGTSTPHAPLQFASTLTNRKIVLSETANNDHQFFGFGVNTNIARYQIPSTASSHVFYAATSTINSVELARMSGTGFMGIGNNDPHSLLHFSNTPNVRKITLREVGNNDHEFFGFGASLGQLHHQVPSTSGNHVFYAGTSSTTSNELARIAGNGDLIVAGNIYGSRPSAIIYSGGVPNTTPIIGTWVKINAATITISANVFDATIDNRLMYIGDTPITVQCNLNITLTPTTTLYTNYGISIFKNDNLITGSASYVSTTNSTYNNISTNTFTTMEYGDYIEAYILADRTDPVATSTLILSVTTT